MMFWVPDWPVHAHMRASNAPPEGDTHTVAMALISRQRVVACNEQARSEGVRTGIRLREAQSRCPDLVTHPHDPAIDERQFIPVLKAIEHHVPGIEMLRPGLCAMRARGPTRFYGDERRAASVLLDLATELGLTTARIGIADGRFAAEQATRARQNDPGIVAPSDTHTSSGERVLVVAPGASGAFLHPLPVDRVAHADFAHTLRSLGIHTLGALAALPEGAVSQRFGAEGVAAWRLAAGGSIRRSAEILPRTASQDFSVELDFEPPIENSEQLAFGCLELAERFVTELTAAHLVSTSIRIELIDDLGRRYERVWAHPQHFTAADTVNRVRWQAHTIASDAEHVGAGIVHVRIASEQTDQSFAHEPGLWNSGFDERVHHHLSRVQGRLGHTGVCTMELTGGRLLSERQRCVPWATKSRTLQRTHPSHHTDPWPGSLQGPTPIMVFHPPLPADLIDRTGATIGISEDDLLSSRPACLRVAQRTLPDPVRDWSPVWVIREKWWIGTPSRFRLQLQLENGEAWLLFSERGHWFAEGKYD